ncbi:hypothetical protein ASPBRDRAFT_38410 [Aspergillus brasiliensis CBS 101740]|uniref:Uncharacterized protein n=1 Tax=Aspergillus brasiliensis (strain CBS 101740 / IMI 381727 / IBT 21946) TaxID=767769 RepID=A0A1L9UWL5_ASPBC|nr:hypothetical protein ASPBRDRAFT_38410 [Aspergillus brasiliensis CBS 101740]
MSAAEVALVLCGYSSLFLSYEILLVAFKREFLGDDEGRVLETGVSPELVRIALQELFVSQDGHPTPVARK